MTHAFDALGSPIRRAILRELQKTPLSVHEIASRFPVSRPAISRHLSSLKKAGLVQVRHQKRENVYGIRLQGFRPVQHFMEEFWDTALSQLEEISKR